MSLPPRKPDDSECCGSGCNRCVFDIYNEELRIWKQGLGEDSGPTTQILRHKAYSQLRISAIEKDSHNTFIYVLVGCENDQLTSLRAGQHVILRGSFGKQSVCRQYTPLNLGSNLKALRILIKLYDVGKMSSIIRDWKENDIVDCRGPLGNELVITNKWETVILIAAGTGITPMSQIIQTILDVEDEETIITLLYACRTYEEILIKKQLDIWADHWNFTVGYYLSLEDRDTGQNKKKYNDKIFYHRICQSDIMEIVDGINISQSCAFVCGPPGFEDDMENTLIQNHFTRKNVVRF